MKKKILILICLGIFVIQFVSALQTNSSNYTTDVVLSSGGTNITSTNYKTDVITGMITGNSSSSLYKNFFGFFFGEEAAGAVCGNGAIEGSEECDDGNTVSGDGCSSTCTTEAAVVTPGGGGGGARAIVSSFNLNESLIKVIVKQGESERKIVKIKNTGDTGLNISLDLGIFEKFMVASENSFLLAEGESKEIMIDVFAREEEVPDAYTGTIIFSDEKRKVSRTINVILEVKEKKPLFDVVVDVLFRRILPGKDVSADISVINMGDLSNIDILLYYAIKDFEGNVLTFKEESIAIEDKLEISRKLQVPEDAKFGDYVFYTKVSYENVTAFGTDTFKVVEKGGWLDLILYVVIFILILIFVLIIWKRRKHKKEVKRLEAKKKQLHQTIRHQLKRKR